MTILKYGIIGAGMMGQEHIRYLNMIDGVKVTALADPDESMRQLAASLVNGEVDIFEDYQQLIALSNVDVYLVASPNQTHYQIMMDLINRTNKPIMVEKPLAINHQQTKEIWRLEQQRKAPIWVTMEYRYMPPLQRLLQTVEQGGVGRPIMMSIKEHRYPFLEKVADWNRFNQNTGGTLVEKCCHYFDLMRLVMKSEAVKIYASGAMDVNHINEQYPSGKPDIIDNAFVVVDFANKTRAMLDLCMFSEGSDWQEIISVTGDKARADSFIPAPLRFRRNGTAPDAEFILCDRLKRTQTREVIAVEDTLLEAGDHHGSTYYQHLKFRDMLMNGGNKEKVEVGVADGHFSVMMGELAEQSAREGRAIDVPKD